MKKFILFITIILISCFSINVYASEIPVVYIAKTTEYVGDNFCSQPEVINVMRVIGYFIFVAKIFVPFIIIGFGTFDLYKGVTGGDEKALKDAAKKFGIRTLIGIVIFLIPTVLNIILTAVEGYSAILEDSHICQTCLLKPSKCENGVPADTNPFDEDVFEPMETYDPDAKEEEKDEDIVIQPKQE